MATITTTPTTPQIEGIVRRTLFERFLRETGLGVYGTVTGGGATTTFGDTTKLKSTQYDSKDHVGGWARISYDAGGAAAAPEGEISPVTTYDPTHASTHITVNPAITAVATGDKYEIWKNPSPSLVIDMLNELLTEELYMPCWTPCSELPDFDMEQNNTTDWTASVSTVTKVTAEPVMNGKRYLSVANAGYAKSASDITVVPGKTYFLSAIARCSAATGSAKLLAYDVTNSADINSVSTSLTTNSRIYMRFTVPATCYAISIRLTTVTAITTYWDDAILYDIEASNIRLPWWVKQKSQVLGVLRLQPAEIATNTWDWNLRGQVDNKWDVVDSSFGGGQLRLQARYGNIGDPLFIIGLRNEEAYANDNTDKKLIDSNMLLAALKYKVWDSLKNRTVSGFNATQINQFANESYSKWRQLEAQQRESLLEILRSPQPSVSINDRYSRIRY